MDERKLSELLRDAVADAPPPTFDQHDVARESERQRVRVRNGILTGSALGVALLAGATALSVALWTGADSSGQPNAAAGHAAPSNGNTAPNESMEERAADAPAEGDSSGDQQSSSPGSRKQGRTSEEGVGPLGSDSTPGGCEQADRELAAALAGELPAAALPGDYGCEPGMTNVTFTVGNGSVSAFLLEGDDGSAKATSDGFAFEQAEAATDDGRRIVIFSVGPNPGPPPLADELDEWAARVADRY